MIQSPKLKNPIFKNKKGYFTAKNKYTQKNFKNTKGNTIPNKVSKDIPKLKNKILKRNFEKI